MTVAASTVNSGHPAWHAFDSNTTTTYWGANQRADSYNQWVTWTTSSAIKMSSLTITNGNWSSGLACHITGGKVEYSSDGSTWTSLKSWTNTNTTKGSSWSISSLGESSGHKYHRLYITAQSSTASGYKCAIGNIKITAQYQTSSYNYYWNKTVS